MLGGVLLNAGALVLLGFAVAVGGRRQLGGTLTVLGSVFGWLAVGATALSSVSLICAYLQLMTEAFSAVVGLVMVGSLLLHGGRPALAAAGVATVMLALTAHYEDLAEMRRRLEDLHRQAGDAAVFRAALNLHADSTTPMVTFEALARASQRAGYRNLGIISLPRWPIAVWTRPMIHVHVCALEIELAEDGEPLSEFLDWRALVEAADRAEGNLRIRVK